MYITYSDMVQTGIFICALWDCAIQSLREKVAANYRK